MKYSMDLLRRQTLEYLSDLWQEQEVGGGFRLRKEEPVGFSGTVDAAWIFYLLDAGEEIEHYKVAASEYIHHKRKADGRFCHDGYHHYICDAHAFHMAARALHIFGSGFRKLPEYTKPFLSVDYTEQWFRSIDWRSAASNHHEVVGLIPVMHAADDPEWEKMLFRNIAAQQDEATGAWCNKGSNVANISRSLAYTVLYAATGQVPPHAERLVETVLALQKENGFWEQSCDFPEFYTMDAVYLIWRLGNMIGYPFEKRRDVLEKVSEAMIAYFNRMPVDQIITTHILQGNLHTIGLLSEALPEHYETKYRWKFDWEKDDIYHP